MELAIMIEGQDGLTWERWKRLAAAAEDFGFAGLYRSDHYTNARPPEKDSLELWVSLTYLASHTQRIQFGPLVSPFSFRHPSITARMAAGVDDLSGGRLQLGLGAGWQEREHTMFGLDLLDLTERMQRFEEGLQVVTLLLSSDVPINYAGEFYQLNQAILLPRPLRPGGPAILVGGNGIQRTLRLAAQYADEWNGVFLPANQYRQRCQVLDEYLSEHGRQPGDLRRSLMTSLHLGAGRAKQQAETAGRSQDELRAQGRLLGEPAQVVEQLAAFKEAGCQRVMLQWLDQDDIAGLETIAKQVLPQVA